MDILLAIGFLYVILFITVLIKANFFSLIFMISIFLFIMLWLFLLKPYEIMSSIFNNIILNPWGLFLIIAPLFFIILIKKFKKSLWVSFYLDLFDRFLFYSNNNTFLYPKTNMKGAITIIKIKWTNIIRFKISKRKRFEGADGIKRFNTMKRETTWIAIR